VGLPGVNATAEQLRSVSADALLKAAGNMTYGEIVDGRLMHEPEAQAFADGHAVDVPMIIGSNSFEASLLRAYPGVPGGPALKDFPAVKAAYASESTTPAELRAHLFTDVVMGAPARWIATREAGGAPAYLYHFSYVPKWLAGKVKGATHGSEMVWVFGTAEPRAKLAGATLNPEDLKIEHLMHSCWIGFAKTGKPDCDGADWPAWNLQTATLMQFGNGSDVGPKQNFRKAQYDALGEALLPPRHLPFP
jgi:para-nitrobenzyl esterase